ncbi:MAG: aspartate carbamoyltransferase catalytic subunit [Dehalococcoidia bacterium]|nr:aspartate carbamoyltransferase catalytic subunit [Dehalococcoidia bacterium]
MLDVRTQAAPADGPVPTEWTRKDLLDTDTLSAGEIALILDTAEGMREVRSRPVSKVATLRGVTVVTLFYEQSTRTRASFEVAAKALGADVVNLTASGSSVEKGESLIDTVRTLEAIGADLLVMRHGKSGAPYLAARNTTAGVINGGDGTHAHPTQALLDLFTMRCHVGDLAGKKVVIVGDVLHSRVARSNLWTLLASGADVTLCGPATLVPRSLQGGVAEQGRCTVTTNFDEALDGADVVMALRMQKERQEKGLIPSLREYITGYQLNARRLALARPGALVMHPGPMNEGIEISPEVAHGLTSVIEEQVANGVAVRMAILYLMATARHA